MKLTRDDQAVSLRRYAHLRPVGHSKRCARHCPGTRYTCSLKRGHRGPHAAHDVLRRLCAVWDSGDATHSSSPSPPARRRPSHVRSTRDESVAGWVRRWVGSVFSHLDELAMIAFFCVFVYYGFQWLLLIFQ